jgi:hypothetical protein
MPMQELQPNPDDIARAVARLTSLHEGDLAVVEAVACGKGAIPALRSVLMRREPSGLFEVRCRAVAALAALEAYDVLIEFLEANRFAADPVERLGDDAVINAAALALAKLREERVFRLLLRLAERSCLTGVVGALGAFDRIEAIPVLVDALEDDASRQTAAAALERMGRDALPLLVAAATRCAPDAGSESVASLRRRRAALSLLMKIGLPRRYWASIRPLMDDADIEVCFAACDLCLTFAPRSERSHAAGRLVALLSKADWMLREEIENCLMKHFGVARDAIGQAIEHLPVRGEERSAAISPRNR